MKELVFNNNQLVFRQGDLASVMYVITDGRIGIFTDYQTEKEEKIAELGAGEVFGEMGMIEIWPRSATAVALADGTVLHELGEADLSEYLKDKPEELLQVMRQISRRLRETTQKYVELCRVVSERQRAERENDREAQRRYQQEMLSYAMLYTENWME